MHEIVGYAGAAIVVVIPVKAVSTSTAYMNVDWAQFVAERGLDSIGLVAASGTIAESASTLQKNRNPTPTRDCREAV